MSYILQALQRAEAERKRGTTPGLDTPAALPGTAAAPRGTSALPWVMAGAAAVLGGAVVAWWLWPAAAVAPPVTSPPVAQAPVAVPAPLPAPASASAPMAAPDRAPAQALPETPIVAAPPEPVAKLEPAAPRRTPPAPAAVAQAQSPVPAPAVPPPQPQPQPAPGAERLPTLHELPASLRQGMPILNVTGGVHSHEPANRMLIVNGQVLREKAQLGPELVLESIGSRSAVFRFRGTRFEVGY